jgi:3-oxoacyl-(acyl-carrier-protein) synthase
MSRRVVVTGIGLISPVGQTGEESWRNVVHGVSGIGPITRFDASRYPSRIAGEVRDFCADRWMSPRDAALSDPFLHYAVAAATSTTLGDKVEVEALRQVFGPALARIPVSSTKSTTGHMLGAAGSAEAIFCLLVMRDEIVPPTINQECPDPACAIDTVPNVPRAAKPEHVLSNSFGFGGHNVSLVFRRAH